MVVPPYGASRIANYHYVSLYLRMRHPWASTDVGIVVDEVIGRETSPRDGFREF